jgi:hypothetical protein
MSLTSGKADANVIEGSIVANIDKNAEFSSIYGSSRLIFFNCPFIDCGAGKRYVSCNIKVNPEKPWLLHITCDRCSCTWNLCRECRQNQIMYSSLQIRRHERMKHPPANKDKFQTRKKVKTAINSTNKMIEHSESSSHANLLESCVHVDCSDVTLSEKTFFGTEDGNYNTNLADDLGEFVPLSKQSCFAIEEENCSKNLSDDMGEYVSADVDDNSCNYFLSNKYCFNGNDAFATLFNKYDISSLQNSLQVMNTKSCNYFLSQASKMGRNYLVSLAHNGGKPGSLSSLLPQESLLQMNISLFVNDLTFAQQKLFSSILFDVTKLYLLSQHSALTPLSQLPSGSDSMMCSLPTSHSSLRRFFTDGRYSINNNLPRPTMVMLTSHSYVSIKESLSDFFGHGNHDLVAIHQSNSFCFDDPVYVTNMFESLAGRQILRNCQERMNSSHLMFPTVPVFLMFWSDDFEPSNSIKSNRQSVWIKTMTIVVQSLSSLEVSSATYPVAIGKKDTSHEEVERKLIEELCSLKNGPMVVMYSNYLKSPIHVHADTYCILNDQPERRSGLCLAGGSSKFHRRWGYSCDVKRLSKKIPGCERCMLNINSSLNLTNPKWIDSRCSDCMKWMYDDTFYNCDEDLHIVTMEHALTQTLFPFKLRLDELHLVVSLVHDGIVTQTYSPKEAESIMQFHCLSSYISDNVIRHAKNCLLYNNASSEQANDPDSFALVQEDMLDNPAIIGGFQHLYPGHFTSQLTYMWTYQCICYFLV